MANKQIPKKQVTRRRRLARLITPFQEFLHQEASSGLILLACTLIALIWANSPWGHSYVELWERKIAIGVAPAKLSLSLAHWINDGLMAIFFFVVGLEIKREVLVGELASLRKATLPIVAAVGGMVAPALLYSLFNFGGKGESGWGIPMATDIAFAVGILALLGRHAPLPLKIFLTALAIVDDMGAVLVIAIFYSHGLVWVNLLLAAVILLVLFGFNRAGIRHPLPYLLLGVVLWWAIFGSGIHATIAGVLLALTIPARQAVGADDTATESLLQRLEHALHPWVAFLIMPIFALANAGITLESSIATVLGNPISWGVIAGLVVGKQVGITAFAWLAVKSGLAALPQGVSWRQIYGAAWLGGIGFTMSLFIAGLAFGEGTPLLVAKFSILLASLLAGLGGWYILRSAQPVTVLASDNGQTVPEAGETVSI